MNTSPEKIGMFQMDIFSNIIWQEKKIIVVTFTTMPGTGKSKIIKHLLPRLEKAYHVDGDGKELFGNAKKNADVLCITSSNGNIVNQTLAQFMNIVEDGAIIFIDKNIHRPQSFKGQFNKMNIPAFWLPLRLSPARTYNDNTISAENKETMMNFLGEVIMERTKKEPNHSLRPDNVNKAVQILKGHMKNQKGLKFPRMIEIDVLDGFDKFHNIDDIIENIVRNLNVLEALVPIGMGKDEPFQVRLSPRDQEEFWDTLEKNLPENSLSNLIKKSEFHVTVSFERFIFHLLTKKGDMVNVFDMKEITITHILLKKDKFLVCFGNNLYQFTGAPLHLTMALGKGVQAVTTGERARIYLDNGIINNDETLLILDKPQTFSVEVVVVGCSDKVINSFGLNSVKPFDVNWKQMSLQEAYDHLYNHPMVKSVKTPFPYSAEYVVIDMKVFARGRPDDEIYQTNPDLLTLLPRGCTWLVKSNKVVKRLATGIPKFFGGKSGDDDDSEKGCLGEYPNSKLLEVWGSKKANGENGQISLMELDNKRYWVVGSKNVKLILPFNYTLKDLVYDDRTKFASMIGALWLNIKDSIDSDILSKLVNKTMVFEMEHIDSQHIVLLTRSVLFLITVLDNDTVAPDHKLYQAMINKYLEGLQRQKYDVDSWEEFWDIIDRMRKDEQLEGDVMEMTIKFEDGNVSTMRFKFKTYWYIFLRCLREKLKKYVGQVFEPASLERDFHRRVTILVEQKVLPKDEFLTMKRYATALAGYASKMWYNIVKDDFIAKYPLHIQEFNETIGIKSYRNLVVDNVYKKVMATIDSIEVTIEYPTLYVSFRNVPEATKLKKEHLTRLSGKFYTNQINLIDLALKKGWAVTVLRYGFDEGNKQEKGVLNALGKDKFKDIQFE